MQRHSWGVDPPEVSVLTPTITGREWFLEEEAASVAAQLFESYEHLILLDEERRGCSWTMNELAKHARGAFLFIHADDDIMLPRCLELFVERQRETGADIVYGPPLVFGEPPAQFQQEPPKITACSLIHADLWYELGGYDLALAGQEDRDFYVRAMAAGANFARCDQHPTKVYRFHGANKSRA